MTQFSIVHLPMAKAQAPQRGQARERGEVDVREPNTRGRESGIQGQVRHARLVRDLFDIRISHRVAHDDAAVILTHPIVRRHRVCGSQREEKARKHPRKFRPETFHKPFADTMRIIPRHPASTQINPHA